MTPFPNQLPSGTYRFGLIPGVGIGMSCTACDNRSEASHDYQAPPAGLINTAQDAGGYMIMHESIYHPELKKSRQVIYVIWSVHHHGYYRHGGRGFSLDIETAQRFTLEQALPELTMRAFSGSPMSAYALVAAPENWPTADEATNAPNCTCGHTILWHRNEFQSPPVGCEADECMCSLTPQQILAELAASGQGRPVAAPAYVNHDTPAQQMPFRRAWRSDSRGAMHPHQRLETDRGIILGTCAHWWQPATAEPTDPLDVLDRAGNCPWCGRPAAVIVGNWEEAWPEPSISFPDDVPPGGDLPEHVPLPFVAPDSAAGRFVNELDAAPAAAAEEAAGYGPRANPWGAAPGNDTRPDDEDPFATVPELNELEPPAKGAPRLGYWPAERPLAIVRPAGTDAGAPVRVCTESECGHLVSRHQDVGCVDCPCEKPYNSFPDNALAEGKQ